MWIKREISVFIESNQDPIQVVRGPRQCGKSSLLARIDSDFEEISLDDSRLRQLAQNDPELFLKQFENKKIFIDEAQYAPNIFPALKRKIDLLKRNENYQSETIVRLSGSNQILMDRQIKESLSGRASFFNMNTLSVSEILAARDMSIQEIMYMGGWPELHARPEKDTKKYLDDYINSYIEKDIVLSAGIQKSNEFLKFIQLLAGRVGQLLDLSSFAGDVGVDTKTIKDWISVLEQMHVIVVVQPYFTHMSKRLLKTPKVFFIDSGLACRLQGWQSPLPILSSPQQGHLFENLVFGEIFKLNMNHQLGWKIYHWRTREKEEIDFLIEKSPVDFIFVESKMSSQRVKPISEYNEVKKVFQDKVPRQIVCHQEGDRILGDQVPIKFLSEFLLNSD